MHSLLCTRRPPAMACIWIQHSCFILHTLEILIWVLAPTKTPCTRNVHTEAADCLLRKRWTQKLATTQATILRLLSKLQKTSDVVSDMFLANSNCTTDIRLQTRIRMLQLFELICKLRGVQRAFWKLRRQTMLHR